MRVGQMLRRSRVTWRYGLNLAPTMAYAKGQAALSEEARRVLATLERDGMAMTSVDSLLGSTEPFAALTAAVDGIERERAVELTAGRAAANGGQVGQKAFNVELLGSTPALDTESVYARFALQAPILSMANAYFGMYTRLRYYNVWHTFASQSPARESQLWHRDREDRFILKIFAYLVDVGHEAGPFTYAPGTHGKGHVSRTPDYSLEGRVQRSTDRQMAAVVPEERWIEAIGPRGTIVFADTHGYHKGGLARSVDRLMYTCMFTSQASDSRDLFDRRRPAPVVSDPAAAFAVR
jgi:hypothetical protein